MRYNVCVQSHWRRVIQQREYHHRLQYLYQNWRAVVKVKHDAVRHTRNTYVCVFGLTCDSPAQIQATVKMWLARRRYLARLAYFRRHVRITPASSPACLRVAYVFTCLCLICLSGRSYNPDPGVKYAVC